MKQSASVAYTSDASKIPAGTQAHACGINPENSNCGAVTFSVSSVHLGNEIET